jgi:hypothetical protein
MCGASDGSGYVNADARVCRGQCVGLREQFRAFSSHVVIPSKDAGLIPYRPWGTQRYLIEQIFRGLEDDIHDFVVLKPRQVGASTAMWVFDPFWCLRNKGIQGELIADADDNKEFARDVLSEVVKTIPVKYSYPIRINNRTQIAWSNGSRLLYQVAGTKESGGKRLGRSRGLNFVHATEVAYWGNPQAIDSLQSALSETHPLACYLWESTANGFNHFQEQYTIATRATTSRAIFIPWWRHELYELKESAKAYRVYWDGKLTGEERAWQREITRVWQVELTPGQWAWYRWRFAEKHKSNQLIMHQEYPTLPSHAFQASGQSFLGAAVMADLREKLSDAPPPTYYRYTFGATIEACRLEPTSASMAELTVWEEPDDSTQAHYIIACDPAYGRGADADRSAITVWKAQRTRLAQVAEFVSDQCEQHQFAWVSMHLCGAYQRAYHILEINGPGMGVWSEEQRLLQYGWGTARQAELQNVLGGIQHYIYRRPDSMGGGMNWQWLSNDRGHSQIWARLRGCLVQGQMTVRSSLLVAELGQVRQDQDRYEAQGSAHDDIATTAALACEMWSEQVLPLLHTIPEMSQAERADGKPPEAPPAHERAFREFLDEIQRRA